MPTYQELLNKYKLNYYDTDFVLTNECNKNCKYCDFPHISEHSSLSDVGKFEFYLGYIIEKYIELGINKNVGIIGGEIGLLPSNIIDSVIGVIDAAINRYRGKFKGEFYVATNGLAIKKYPQFLNVADLYIDYHVTDDELDSFDPDIYSQYNRIRYNIVVHKENYSTVTKIKHKFPDVMIKFNDCYSIRDGKAENSNLMGKYKIFDNKKCTQNSPFFSIDLATDKICKCCRSYTRFEKVNLSKENIDKCIAGKMFSPTYDICKSCRWNY